MLSRHAEKDNDVSVFKQVFQFPPESFTALRINTFADLLHSQVFSALRHQRLDSTPEQLP
jgi:hypothetical protein